MCTYVDIDDENAESSGRTPLPKIMTLGDKDNTGAKVLRHTERKKYAYNSKRDLPQDILLQALEEGKKEFEKTHQLKDEGNFALSLGYKGEMMENVIRQFSAK